MNKVLRVNMHTATVTTEVLKDEYRLLGNRGLVDKVLTDEVDPRCDPLGEENKLVFALGLLAGTGFPTGNRISVGAKSPLTGGIKEANSGGNLGSVLARQGIMMIIVEGCPAEGRWYMLHIDAKGEARLVDAADYMGQGTYAVVERLRATHGEKAAIALIGGAGERGYHNSTIQVTDDATGHPSRALARGGIGAVMGSKHLKAIVVDWADERAPIEYADRKRFMNATKAYLTVLGRNQATGGALGLIGTMAGITITGKNGALPVKNFSGERCGIIGSIGSEAFLKTIMRRGGKTGLACQPGCPIRCSNIYNDSQGHYLTSGFEYETIALVGANCDIADLDAIARIERT